MKHSLLLALALVVAPCCGDGDESIRQHPQIKEVMKKLNFSESYRMILCVGFGYPDESAEAKDRDSSKYRFVEF